jgi:hypothetical protein
LALALMDTMANWSPRHTPTVRSWSFAGPTAGNVGFAAYSDHRMGTALHRWVNTLDIAPLAWNESTLDDTIAIYASYGLWPSWAELAALGLAKTLAAGGGYLQPSQGTVTRSGDYNLTSPTYATQADWQHTQGYAAILGLSNVLPRKTSTPTPQRTAARLEAMRQGAATPASPPPPA